MLTARGFSVPSERIAALLCQVIEHHLRGRDYSEAMLPQWINDIAESCMEELHAPKKPFKYIGEWAMRRRGGMKRRKCRRAIHAAALAELELRSTLGC